MSLDPVTLVLVFLLLDLLFARRQVRFAVPPRQHERLLQQVLLAVEAFLNGFAAALSPAKLGPLQRTQLAPEIALVGVGT